jgi:hypothetical protein
MKRYIPILLMVLLLAGCRESSSVSHSPAPTPSQVPEAAPTPVPEETETSPRGIALDVGDGEHTFWVELTEREEDIGGVWVNIYRDRGDAEPFQQFEDHVSDLDRADIIVEDVDFDGNMDFHFERSWGSLPLFWHSYYVWDADTEKFVPDPYDLNALANAEFNPYAQEVSTATRVQEYYQYEDGKLHLMGERFSPQEGSGEVAYKARYVTVDDTHTFWVELVDTEKYGTLLVNIYEEQTDREPLQTFENQYECLFEETYFFVEDVDFDGDMDFYFMTARGHFSVSFSSYYIWDGEKFVSDPYGLNEVCYANFHPETKVVESIRVNSVVSGVIELYRYIDGKLTCLRRLERWDPSGNELKLMVHDWKDGEWTVAYETVIDVTKLEPGGEFDPEFSRWYDLNYHGGDGE